MVTSKTWHQRWLHRFLSLCCGRDNSCIYNGKPKIDYKSQASAEKAAVSFGNKVGRDFDVYNCWFCGGWHIGGAHNLTFWKFVRIVWFGIIRKKRTTPKIREYRKEQPVTSND